MYDFGLKLRSLRKSRNITQKRLADMLGVTEGTISKYESNLVMPPFEAIRSLSAIIGVSLDELYGTEQRGTVSISGLSEDLSELVRDIVDMLRAAAAYLTKKLPRSSMSFSDDLQRKL